MSALCVDAVVAGLSCAYLPEEQRGDARERRAPDCGDREGSARPTQTIGRLRGERAAQRQGDAEARVAFEGLTAPGALAAGVLLLSSVDARATFPASAARCKLKRPSLSLESRAE